MSTGCSGETRTASAMNSRRSSSSCTMRIARPPSTYEGRTSTGNPIPVAIVWASGSERAVDPAA